MDIKAFPFEIKANAEARTFEGYASTWHKDLVNDQIQQGAFRKSIAERFPKNQIKVLWQHTEPLGMPTHMEEDSKGLYVVGKISKTSLGNDALELMRDGVIDSMSIGYDVLKDSLSDDGQTRNLHELKLYEFSPVTFPANPMAAVTAVKRSAMFGFDYDIGEIAKLIKAGRVLSAVNAEKLRNVVSELSDLLKTVEVEPLDDTSKEKPLEGTPLGAFTALLNEIKNYTKERRTK
jgi:HK97 family phage prohead protease